LRTEDGVVRFRARQQAATGRGGYVDVEVRVRNGEPVDVAITGHAVLGSQVAQLLPDSA
jgi:predicted PhzF superfamily epimerase YddE/YHI9